VRPPDRPALGIDDHRIFTLDGDVVDIATFIEDNGFDRSDLDQITRLEVGEHIIYGGGAFAEFVLRRIR
jgi:hypothetical protein